MLSMDKYSSLNLSLYPRGLLATATHLSLVPMMITITVSSTTLLIWATNNFHCIIGAAYDVCPDTNPYLQTTCGVRDSHVLFGDSIVSVEHLGLFRASETITFDRCVHSKPAASTVRKLWTGQEDTRFSQQEVREFIHP